MTGKTSEIVHASICVDVSIFESVQVSTHQSFAFLWLNVENSLRQSREWVMGHGSNGSRKSDGSHGSWVTRCWPMTHQFFNSMAGLIQGGPKKPDHFWKYVTPAYDDVVGRSIYQNVQLLIRSKMGILNGAIFKYSLHKFRITTPHQKYQLI